jgi:hypothetical protein
MSSSDKNRFDKYIPLFSPYADDKRVRLFIHELEQLAHNTMKEANLTHFNADLLGEWWLFNPDKYTDGMRNRNYNESVQPPSQVLGIVLPPVDVVGAPGGGGVPAVAPGERCIIHNQHAVLPSVNPNSMNPQFLTFIILVCQWLNSRHDDLTLTVNQQTDPKSKITFDKFKENLAKLTNTQPNSTDCFVICLLQKMGITCTPNNLSVNFNTGILDNITDITIPSLENLIFNIFSCQTVANVPGVRNTYADAANPDKFRLLKNIVIGNEGDTTLSKMPNGDNEVNYPKNLYDINQNINIILNILCYILNIEGSVMSQIVTNFELKNRIPVAATNTLGQQQQLLIRILTQNQVNFNTQKNAILNNVDTILDTLLLRYIPQNNKYFENIKNTIKNKLRTIITSIEPVDLDVGTTHLKFTNMVETNSFLKNHNNKPYIFKQIHQNNNQNTALIRRKFIFKINNNWQRAMNQDEAVVGQYNLLINIMEILFFELENIIFPTNERMFDYNFAKYAKFLILSKVDQPVPIKNDDDEDDDDVFDFNNDNNQDTQIYYRNKDGNLCIIKDGKEIEVNRGSDLFNKVFADYADDKCKIIGMDNKQNNENCGRYLIDCLEGDEQSIKKCNHYLNDPNFWIKSNKDVDEMLPILAVDTLEKLKFQKETYSDEDNNILYKYQNYSTWLKSLSKNIPEFDFDKIKSNHKLRQYIQLLILKINNNPSILNPEYVANIEKEKMKKEQQEVSEQQKLIYSVYNLALRRTGNIKLMSATIMDRYNQIVGLSGGDPFNTSEYQLIQQFANKNIQNITNNGLIYRKALVKYVDLLKQKGKSLAKTTIEKINKLINIVDKYDKQANKLFAILEGYNRAIQLEDFTPEKNITYTKMFKKINVISNKKVRRLGELTDIFSTLQDIFMGQVQDEEDNSNNTKMSTSYRGL